MLCGGVESCMEVYANVTNSVAEASNLPQSPRPFGPLSVLSVTVFSDC